MTSYRVKGPVMGLCLLAAASYGSAYGEAAETSARSASRAGTV